MAKTPSSQCRGSRLDCCPGNLTPHTATEAAACCRGDPVRPHEHLQKLNLCLACSSRLVAVYQLLVLIQLTRAVSSRLSRVQLCDPMDCGPPGSSVHGILQARTRVGYCALLQGIFPTQGLNLCLLPPLHWQVVCFFFYH